MSIIAIMDAKVVVFALQSPSYLLQYISIWANNAQILTLTKIKVKDHKEVRNMNKYEILYIINNSLDDEAKQVVVDKIESIVTSNGGTVENIDKWGARKFAYPIDYKTEGYYVLMNFEAESTVPALLERQIRIMDETFRCMILKK